MFCITSVRSVCGRVRVGVNEWLVVEQGREGRETGMSEKEGSDDGFTFSVHS